MTEDRDTAFVARITAGATHEIRNVLAIVKESAGLIEDMIRVFDKRGSLDKEKLTRAVGRIDAQVGRGAEIITNLNRFAHSLDHRRAEIDLRQEAQQVVFLCQRFTRQKRHSVCVQPSETAVPLVTNPLRLQMALCAGVECCLEQLPEGSSLTVHLERENGGASLHLLCDGAAHGDLPDPTRASGWQLLCEILSSLGGKAGAHDAHCRLKITLPGAVPP